VPFADYWLGEALKKFAGQDLRADAHCSELLEQLT